MGRAGVLLFFALGVAVVTATSPACNFFKDYGDLWGNAEATSAGAGGNMCAGFGGYGGEGGDGGDGGGGGEGAGGDGSGAGAGPGVSVGAGGSSEASAGAGVGGGDARAGGDAGHVARGPRHRGHRGGLGTAQQAGCSFPAWTFPPIPTPIPIPPSSVSLTTTRLRYICTANGIGAGLTGIQFSNKCGLAFQNWVLWMLQESENKTPITSPARTAKNAPDGPNAVVPDYWRDLKLAYQDSPMVFTIPKSFFGEVKAVNGYLPPSYSKYQVLGLLDVAQISPAGSSTLPKHPPPEVVFTTTGNTIISPLTLGQANLSGVAIWQQVVFENPAMANDPNPDLCINACVPLNQGVYPPTVTPYPTRPNPTCTKLTDAPPTWAPPNDNNPDPPTVDP